MFSGLGPASVLSRFLGAWCRLGLRVGLGVLASHVNPTSHEMDKTPSDSKGRNPNTHFGTGTS